MVFSVHILQSIFHVFLPFPWWIKFFLPCNYFNLIRVSLALFAPLLVSLPNKVWFLITKPSSLLLISDFKNCNRSPSLLPFELIPPFMLPAKVGHSTFLVQEIASTSPHSLRVVLVLGIGISLQKMSVLQEWCFTNASFHDPSSASLVSCFFTNHCNIFLKLR